MGTISNFKSYSENIYLKNGTIVFDTRGYEWGEDCGRGFELLAEFEYDGEVIKMYFREKTGFDYFTNDKNEEIIFECVNYLTERDTYVEEGIMLNEGESIVISSEDGDSYEIKLIKGKLYSKFKKKEV